MKFVLAKSLRYWWPVTVRIPDPVNAGEFVAQKLRLQFEPAPLSEERAESEKARKLKTPQEFEEWVAARYRRVIKDWDGVVDEAGNVVPVSPERLDAAMEFNWFRAGVKAAFDASISAEEARLGN